MVDISAFVEARWYTPVSVPRRVDYIVIHDMEMAEKGSTAEDCAAFFQRLPSTNKASAHYCVDNNTIVQCVRENDIAYHAPPNLHSIGIEHAGFAAQSRDQWLDTYGTSMLLLSAGLMAELLAKYGLPTTFLTAAELKAGGRGVTTHRNVSAAFGQTTHTDPGPDFPVGWYMDRVRDAANPTPPPPEDDMPYSETQLIDFARRAVQAELGDENVGAFSDRVADKVIAKLPPAQGGTAIDYDLIATKVADEIYRRGKE